MKALRASLNDKNYSPAAARNCPWRCDEQAYKRVCLSFSRRDATRASSCLIRDAYSYTRVDVRHNLAWRTIPGFAVRPFLARECPRSRFGIPREYKLRGNGRTEDSAPAGCEERTFRDLSVKIRKAYFRLHEQDQRSNGDCLEFHSCAAAAAVCRTRNPLRLNATCIEPRRDLYLFALVRVDMSMRICTPHRLCGGGTRLRAKSEPLVLENWKVIENYGAPSSRFSTTFRNSCDGPARDKCTRSTVVHETRT